MNSDKKKYKLDDWIPPKETFIFMFFNKIIAIITTFVIFFIMFALNKTKCYGKDVIKKEKAPYIFASNHTSMFDSGFIDCLIFFPKGILSYRYLPYHTPEYGNFYKNKLLAWYMDHVKCIPVERGKGIDQNAQKIVSEKLKNGNIVHIFPEGTRSRTGELLPGKAGVGKRVYETGVKVIPCYHEGVRDVLPVGSKFPKTGNKIKMIIGEPIYFDDLLKLENKPETWKMISQRIMNEIRNLKEELLNEQKT